MSKQEYRRIEDAYVLSALAFLNESGIRKLSLVGIENSRSIQIAGVELCSGNQYDVENVENLFRAVLREQFWRKFEWQNEAYVLFGWDYYMYVGVPQDCRNSIAYAESQGLFVETLLSPYLEGG